ncbi:carnitine--CoA ligase [Heyndrickxia coagulans]|nr:sigma factor G inhibitor Gin [Heyndrickxia coagulans]AVD54696.1 carnitine--CoA ligase [Heyndrickxia coagulans]
MDRSALRHEPEMCIVCEKLKHNGIYLYTSFICSDCEKEMVRTDTGDPRYSYFVRQLKAVQSPKCIHDQAY